MTGEEVMKRCNRVGDHLIWCGPTTVWHVNKVYRPAPLVFLVVTGVPVKPRYRLVKQCEEPDCVEPAHYEEVPKAAHLKQYRFAPSWRKDKRGSGLGRNTGRQGRW